MKGVVLSHHADIQLKMAELVITESDTCWLVLFKVSDDSDVLLHGYLIAGYRCTRSTSGDVLIFFPASQSLAE